VNRLDLAPGETAVAMGPAALGGGPSRGTTSAIRRMSPGPRRSQARTMRSKPMIGGLWATTAALGGLDPPADGAISHLILTHALAGFCLCWIRRRRLS
jgi:hypothetical protein